MSDHHHRPSPDDVHECTEALRSALLENGITLPSLGVELPAFAGAYHAPLVALGNCNAATALRLADVLREAAVR
ncbi:hypothetical protein ACIBK8_12160 [Streptomyces sp. NPDC050161]|uniref:hypothetical protein n=1 Tax=Streptomyces sp. NPDC050161 TaxID=3365604 RepID=UPI00378F7801